MDGHDGVEIVDFPIIYHLERFGEGTQKNRYYYLTCGILKCPSGECRWEKHFTVEVTSCAGLMALAAQSHITQAQFEEQQ